MKRLLPLFLLLLITVAGSAQGTRDFPLGNGNRDGTRITGVIDRNGRFPTYTDKVFYISSTGTPSPAFKFPDYGTIHYAEGCGNRKYVDLYVIYNVDGVENRSYTVNPNMAGLTVTLQVIAGTSRRMQCIAGGTTHTRETLSTITLTFEQPQWQFDELKRICNSVDREYSLTDFFSVQQGVLFYLDDASAAPITVINPSTLTPGFHKLIARKLYDNGTADPVYGSKPGVVEIIFEFEVLAAPQISIQPFPPTLCQNAAPVSIKATPSGGEWSGRGIDAAGNVTPSALAVGRNVFTYRYRNANECVSEKVIEIAGLAPPDVRAEDLDVCRGAASFTLSQGRPTGGIYTGRGVINGITFDPAQALVGGNVITYTYTDPSGCTSEATFTINIIDESSFKVGDDFNTCTSSAEVELNQRSGVSPSDGSIIWTGPGVVNNKYFSPSVAGIGIHTITGSLYVPATGCTYTKAFVVKVEQGPVVSAGPDMEVCNNAATFRLNGASPLGGTWSGDFVDAGNFTPASAIPGNYTIKYTYDAGTCTVSDTRVIAVVAPPVVTAGADFTICRNAGTVQLPAPSPGGGSWGADGPYLNAAAGTVDAALMQVGINRLSYTYTTGTCTVTDELAITVVLPPAVEAGADLKVCINASPVTLGGSPTGGTWSGPGVENGRFLPARAGVGEHRITYLYTDPLTRCSSADELYITVEAAPAVNAGPDMEICGNAATFRLNGASPLGGTWSGDFVDAGNFTPVGAPAGNHVVTYTYNSGTCTVSDTRVIAVVAPPAVTAGADFTICRNAGTVRLPAPSPGGGSWGADGPYLNAAAGTVDAALMQVGINRLSYTYTTGTCTVTDELAITVVLPPAVEAGADLKVCINASPVTLGGSPTGGTWSGPGVENGRFLPARAGVGEHRITYLYTDPLTRCSSADELYITVEAAPAVNAGQMEILCKNTGNFFLSGGSPAGGTWSGDFVENGYFITSKAAVGIYDIRYTYSDGACESTAIKSIQVVDAPTVNAGADFPICQGQAPQAPPVPSPAGGTWSALAGGFYDPATNLIDPAKMQLGVNHLIYQYKTAAGCTLSDTIIITLNPRPRVVGMRDFTICLNGSAIPLQATPQPGMWEGAGVDNNQGSFFNPQIAGAGEHRITYTHTDDAGCSTIDTVIAVVTAAPTLVLPADTAVCIGSGILPLRAQPTGGTWSGAVGLAGYNFNPATAGQGRHELNYTYIDPLTRCSSSASTMVEVKGVPGEILLKGDTAACAGQVVTITAEAANVNEFVWYKAGNAPFATGKTIRYQVQENEKITVQPLPTLPGDCPGEGRTFTIISETPAGAVRYAGRDTLPFGGLYSATSTIQGAVAYAWTFGDGGTSTQVNADHYFYRGGRYTVSLVVTGEAGCRASFVLPPVVVLDENGKVPDPDFSRGEGLDDGGATVSLYPTTFRDKLTVEFMQRNNDEVVIEFFDQNGQKIKEVKRAAVAGRNKIVLETGDLPGRNVYYVVRVSSKELKGHVEKLIKM